MPIAKDEYRAIYFEEVRELLGGAAEYLNTLRGDSTDSDDARAALVVLQRVAHTVKGSAGIMGFVAIRELSRALEAAVRSLRAGQTAPDRAVVTAVCDGFDFLRSANSDLESSGAEDETAIGERARTIDAITTSRR